MEPFFGKAPECKSGPHLATCAHGECCWLLQVSRDLIQLIGLRAILVPASVEQQHG